MNVLPDCMSMQCECAWHPRMPEEGIESLGIRVTDDWELQCRCWDPNLDLL